MDCRAGSQWPAITNTHPIRMSLIYRTATSLVMSQAMGSFARQMSARTVRLRSQQHGLSAHRPWLCLPLTLYHRQEYLQWYVQQQIWAKYGVIPLLQMNLVSIYRIMMITSVFGGIVEN